MSTNMKFYDKIFHLVPSLLTAQLFWF